MPTDDLIQRVHCLASMDLPSVMQNKVIPPESITPEDLCPLLEQADWSVSLDPTNPSRINIRRAVSKIHELLALATGSACGRGARAHQSSQLRWIRSDVLLLPRATSPAELFSGLSAAKGYSGAVGRLMFCRSLRTRRDSAPAGGST